MIGSDINDPVMKQFVEQLDEVNALAEQSEGFVWRLKDENNNATELKVFDDPQVITNMSVWESIEHLEAFVYNGRHVQVMRRRKEWFHKMKLYMALWYLPAGTVPTIDDAKKRLEHLEQHGSTAFAFDFKKRFSPPTIQPKDESTRV
jgi:hypothetical protein